jgi:hypothetical protein
MELDLKVQTKEEDTTKKRKIIKEFIIVDETLLKVGNEYMHGFGLPSNQ